MGDVDQVRTARIKAIEQAMARYGDARKAMPMISALASTAKKQELKDAFDSLKGLVQQFGKDYPNGGASHLEIHQHLEQHHADNNIKKRVKNELRKDLLGDTELKGVKDAIAAFNQCLEGRKQVSRSDFYADEDNKYNIGGGYTSSANEAQIANEKQKLDLLLAQIKIFAAKHPYSLDALRHTIATEMRDVSVRDRDSWGEIYATFEQVAAPLRKQAEQTKSTPAPVVSIKQTTAEASNSNTASTANTATTTTTSAATATLADVKQAMKEYKDSRPSFAASLRTRWVNDGGAAKQASTANTAAKLEALKKVAGEYGKVVAENNNHGLNLDAVERERKKFYKSLSFGTSTSQLKAMNVVHSAFNDSIVAARNAAPANAKNNITISKH